MASGGPATLEPSALGAGLGEDPHLLLVRIRQKKAELAAEIQGLKDHIDEIKVELEELDEYDAEDDDDVDSKARCEKRAKREFNIKPKKGIADLIESGLNDGSATSIAKWLFETEGLKKGAIGEFMGENDPLNLEVLKEFANLHEFAQLDFDAALRAYLGSFRLPGEAQKIDRMMERFAARFCECNPGVFSHEDTCYVLAFSTIMLNTALHNPAVKHKQTLPSFISMNRGIDQGRDIDEELLTRLFHSIQTTEFKMPDDEGARDASASFFNPERSGWMLKEGGSHKTWKKRWFTLVNNCLYYFEDEAASKPKGTIPLENLFVRELPQSKKQHCFEILCEEGESVKGAKTNRKGQIVQGKHASYKLQAADPVQMEDWINSIRAAMQRDPVFEMFQAHRRKARVE